MIAAPALNLRGRHHVVHLLFRVGVIGKGMDGVLELAGGLLLLFVTPAQVQGAVRTLTLLALDGRAHNFMSHLLSRSVEQLSGGSQSFAVILLLSHGVVKVGLVLALLLRKWWAYPAAIAVFSVFVGYQLYRYAQTHSVWLVAFSALDLGVIALTWLEYRRLSAQAAR